MALVKGTNCGFLSSTKSPTQDPEGTGVACEAQARSFKDTAPTGATKVTEIGWYCETATQDVNFEVGIYTHNVGDNNPEAVVGILDQTNAKGTGVGWKKVTGLNIPITAGTIYWICFQLDDTTPSTKIDRTTTSGEKEDWKTGQGTLPEPFGTSTGTSASLMALYARTDQVTTEENLASTTVVGTGDHTSKYVKRNWPITEGLTARSTKQEGRQMHLEPEKSLVLKRKKVGF